MRPDVVIVGGGIMGCASALELAREGLRVLVLERSVPGAEASTAAAGILAPCAESHRSPAALRLGIRSRKLHQTLAAELHEHTGIDVGFRRSGVLKVGFGREDLAQLDACADSLLEHDIVHNRLNAIEVLEREPACSKDIRGGLELPDEAQVEPRQLLRAVAIRAEQLGVQFRTGTTVRKVHVQQGTPRVTLDSETVDASAVVAAAGSWTSLIPGLGIPPETIFPVRGQLLRTQTPRPLFKRIVFGAGGYAVPRPNGDLLCGSTEERVGFSRGVTMGGLQQILRIATRLAPTLDDAPVLEHWSSFRPGTPDDLPLVGATQHERIYAASGHYRNGILLAPLTAVLITDAILGREPDADAATLSPLRFAGP